MRVRRAVLPSVALLLALWCGVEAADDLESHAPIAILSDADFTAGNGVRSGVGTVDDPYLISGWRIDAKQSGHCIRVENVSSIFRIASCTLVGASAYAVKLAGVKRVEIVESCISASLFGLLWESCTGCVLRDCSFDEIGWAALTLVDSRACEVTGSLFVEGGPAIEVRSSSTGNKFIGNAFLAKCRTGIRLEALCGGNLMVLNDFYGPVCVSESHNRWNDTDGNGNYWSRYHGNDWDVDRAGDTYFRVLDVARECDRRPAMAAYHPEAETEWYLCESME